MTDRRAIIEQITAVAAEQSKVLAKLTDDLPLGEIGLDSLGFAILVSRLEDLTGRDPFGSSESGHYPRTLGEFLALYEEPVA